MMECQQVAAVGGTAIIGGHYCASPELQELSAEAETERNTFAVAAEMVVSIRKDGRRATLFLLVNDIGMDLTVRERMKKAYELPAAYREVLASVSLQPHEVTVLFESTMRNTGSKLLREIAGRSPGLLQAVDSDTPELVRCVDRCEASAAVKRAYVLPGPDGAALVVKEGPNPKCNLILATLFRTVAKRSGAESVVAIFNVIYANRVRLGLHVARQLFGLQQNVDVVLMDGDRVLEPRPIAARAAKGTLGEDMEVQARPGRVFDGQDSVTRR